jgi:hypothetical protein
MKKKVAFAKQSQPRRGYSLNPPPKRQIIKVFRTTIDVLQNALQDLS